MCEVGNANKYMGQKKGLKYNNTFYIICLLLDINSTVHILKNFIQLQSVPLLAFRKTRQYLPRCCLVTWTSRTLLFPFFSSSWTNLGEDLANGVPLRSVCLMRWWWWDAVFHSLNHTRLDEIPIYILKRAFCWLLHFLPNACRYDCFVYSPFQSVHVLGRDV